MNNKLKVQAINNLVYTFPLIPFILYATRLDNDGKKLFVDRRINAWFRNVKEESSLFNVELTLN